MSYPPSPYVTAFLAAVPTAFLQDIVEAIFRDYRDAFNACDQAFHEKEAHDVRPIYRRGLIEQDLKSAAIRHGFKGETVANSTTSSFHTEVRIGEVIITENTITSPLEMVKRAEFRSGLAFEYQLPLGLFGAVEEQSNHRKSLYAVIVSGQSKGQPTLPAFVHVVFPDRTFTNYMGRLDLVRHMETMGIAHAGATANVPAPLVTRKAATKRRSEAKGLV